MAVSANRSDDTIYISCSENDIISGEKLSSIIGFVKTELGIDKMGNSPKDTYEKYCNALKRKLGECEPRHCKAEIRECSKDKIINGMLALLAENERVSKFRQLIETTADAAGGNGVSTFWSSDYVKEYKSSEFVVLKVFKSGENLELIPSLLSCYGKQIGSSLFYMVSSKSEATIELQQKTFVVTRFDLLEIINKLKCRKW